jgi:hypothetical protein
MKPFDVDAFLKAVDRRQARRFLPDPLPPTGFGDLDQAHREAPEWWRDWEWNALMENEQ